MSRYEYDVRRPMRRHDDGGSAWGVVLVVILIFVIFAVIVGVLFKQTNDAARQAAPTSVAKARTDDGDVIRVYSVSIDGADYLVTDRGGICERGV